MIPCAQWEPLRIAAVCLLQMVLIASPRAQDAGESESDDIALNLERSDRSGVVKGVSFLENVAAARKRSQDLLGLDYGVTYHSIFAASLLGDREPTAAGGDLTLEGIWKPGQHWRENPTELRFRMRYRHAYGDLAPSQVGTEIGALWGITDGFSDAGFEVPDFYLRHVYQRSGIELRIGQMTIDSQFDSHELRSAKQAFLNQAFSTNPAVAFPRFGAGATLAKQFRNGFGITLGASNVQGTNADDQVDFKLDSSALFEAVQLSYDFPAQNDRATRLQLLLWRTDAVESANRPEGRGASFMFERELSEDLKSFLRFAWSDGAATSVEGLVAGGIGKVVNKKDLAGVSVGVGRGSDADHSIQTVVEGFYRWQIREGIRITGDVQILAGQGFQSSPGLRTIVGVRAGFDF